MKIMNAPMEYATGGAKEFVLLGVAPTYSYETGVRSDRIIGQTLLVGNQRTFDKFRVKIPHQVEKVSPQRLMENHNPIIVRFVRGAVSDYVMDGHLGLSFTADDFEIVSGMDDLMDFGGGLDE